MKRFSFTPGNILIMLIVLVLLMAGCPSTPTTTTTEATTTTTTTTTEATTTTTEATTTTTTTKPEIIITTTTTTTTTIVIYRTTTTIANAVCYMNSDCGVNRIEYVCRISLPSGPQQMGKGDMAVFRVEYAKICIEPGSAYARCDIKRREILWDVCGSGETCSVGCYTCVNNVTKYCPPPEIVKKPSTTTTTLEDDD